MPRLVLTNRFVAGLHPAGRVAYFDSKTRGLALRGTAKGIKTWAFVYRRASKPNWVKLGAYPAVTLADARTLALEMRHAIDVEKRDPATERRAKRRAAKAPPAATAAVFTFADMAKLYEAFARGQKKTWQDDAGKVKRYLIPAWGTLPLRDITRAHVHELLDTLVAKGMTVGVNRIQAVISRIFTLAVDRSLVDAHPAARMIKRFQERPSDRVLTDDELRALWAGLEGRPGRAADALKLRLLLGQRGEEINGMLWSEIDLKGKTWDLPGARTKNGRPHHVPLATTAQQILERRRQEVPQDEPRVFPGLTGWSPDYRGLSELAGSGYEWKDLRRTLSTRLAALGFREEVIGRTLNHAKYTVTARHYIKHAYLTETRQALEAWDQELARLIAHEGIASTNLLPFRN
jgi:integrase